MNLINRNANFLYPTVETPNDIFNYLAIINNVEFFETDLNGVVLNEIKQNYFFVNKLDLASPRVNTPEIKYDGFLFVGIPNDHGTDVDGQQGLYLNITEALMSKSFILKLKNLIACDFEVVFNNVRPLYNTTKYTKATNTTGVEISYSIWI